MPVRIHRQGNRRAPKDRLDNVRMDALKSAPKAAGVTEAMEVKSLPFVALGRQEVTPLARFATFWVVFQKQPGTIPPRAAVSAAFAFRAIGQRSAANTPEVVPSRRYPARWV